ncbi:hypothetical protein [Methylobacterium sp. CCH5-D2]|uniref:hypothetical protein n=1 Tax=Methylobacterium sp. CCH5-D2 TaxID=1768765 RepID=UPI0012E39755|nr:hypothetical protein [Methylobacterium sp. CCH5-D2]
MPSTLIELVNVLLRGIADNEGFARELADMGEQFEVDGNHTAARRMRDLSRHHQVKAIEGRARISVLANRYRQTSEDDHKSN